MSLERLVVNYEWGLVLGTGRQLGWAVVNYEWELVLGTGSLLGRAGG